MQNDQSQLSQLCTASTAALTKLDKYYFKAIFNQYNVLVTSMFFFTHFATCSMLIHVDPLLVLHPCLGLCWFHRLEDKDRAPRAKIIFETVYAEYKRATDSKEHDTTSSLGEHGIKKMSSFLNNVMMNDVGSDSEDETGPGVMPVTSECDSFYVAYKTIDQGDANDPLTWWKVHIGV